MDNFRQLFPAINSNNGIIYFDNASMTQKPYAVINKVNEYLSESINVNYGRSGHTPAFILTKCIDKVREQIKSFLNTISGEIIFTSGSTDSLSKTANFAFDRILNDGDEILVQQGHRANINPWISLQKNHKVQVKVIEFDRNLKYNEVAELVTSKTKFISLIHADNITGQKFDYISLKNMIPERVLISLDASQSICYEDFETENFIDFLSFSGHKMYSLEGIGVLHISDKVINESSLKGSELRSKLEEGTLNITGIISLGEAINFIGQFSKNTLKNYLYKLTKYARESLRELDDIKIISSDESIGILSFLSEKLNANDIGMLLNENNIYIRTGYHCNNTSEGQKESVRISLQIYNTFNEVDRLKQILKTIL